MRLHLIHRYRTVGMVGYRRYQECTVCGKRRFRIAAPAAAGFPLKVDWLNHRTDELRERATPPAGPSNQIVRVPNPWPIKENKNG